MAYQKRYYERNRERMIQEASARYYELKRIVVDGYGGRCACCGETELRFMSVDHVHPVGSRRANRRTSTLFRKIIAAGYPDDYQILCHNCNHGKSRFGACPHAGGKPSEEVTRGAVLNRKARTDAIAAYGGACECCGEDEDGFLNIDHVDGGGCEHRRLLGSNTTIYYWLRKEGYPPGFRVLCTNCNRAVHYGPCPHGSE